VAKILVADDNSNIQKMVGLALKDHGIDVVAVGNGEAAVRKISDVRPDLVLADVFMPVRNGYEVCKYVKADASLSHIPVILLVGAFDPLDEQEAQRVGADGVLKKPFVPPDPLISMVKSALLRASTGQVAALSEKVAAPPPVAPANNVPTVAALPKESGPGQEVEAFVEDIPTRPASVKIDSAAQPLAFGSLLETPGTNAEEEITYVAPNPALLDRAWQAPEEEELEEEEESSDSSWRRDGGNEAFANEVEKTAAESAARRKRREPWTPTREKKQDLIEAADAPDIVTETVKPPAPPIIPSSSASLSTPWASAAPPVVEQKKIETQIAIIPAAGQPTVEPVLTSEPIPGTSPTPAKGPGEGGAWFSVSSSPWEAEAQKASQLASTWDTASAAPPTPQAPAAIEIEPISNTEPPQADSGYEFVSEAPSEEPVFYVPDPALVGNEVVSNETLPELISDGVISAEAVESIRHETSYALESAAKQAQEMSAPSSRRSNSEDAQPAVPDMDALVAKVLAKLSPEMLQAVTREILKPVVEAMVRDEIKPKRP